MLFKHRSQRVTTHWRIKSVRNRKLGFEIDFKDIQNTFVVVFLSIVILKINFKCFSIKTTVNRKELQTINRNAKKNLGDLIIFLKKNKKY